MRPIAALCLLLLGCQELDPPSATAPSVNACAVTDYENGILMFTSCDTGFPNALSAYVKDHPTKEIVSFGAIPQTDTNSQIHGYLVVVREPRR